MNVKKKIMDAINVFSKICTKQYIFGARLLKFEQFYLQKFKILKKKLKVHNLKSNVYLKNKCVCR